VLTHGAALTLAIVFLTALTLTVAAIAWLRHKESKEVHF
jgi:hypothetical protein